MLMKGLTVAFGVLIAASRLVGVFFPGFLKKLIKLMVEEKGALLLLMVYGAVLGGFFVWGFRIEFTRQVAGWQDFVMLVIGVLMALMCLLFLAAPKVLTAMLDRVMKWVEVSEMNMRLLALIGVVFGIIVLLIGLSM